MEFNYIDIVILVPVLYGLYKGFTKGLILSLATLAGLFLGIYGGVKFSHITSKYLFEQFQIDIPLVAFGATFIIIMTLVYILGTILSKFANALSLGLFNNLAGALFGGLKSLVILSVILLFFEQMNATFHVIPNEVTDQSTLYVFLQDTSNIIFPYLEDFKKNAVK